MAASTASWGCQPPMGVPSGWVRVRAAVEAGQGIDLFHGEIGAETQVGARYPAASARRRQPARRSSPRRSSAQSMSLVQWTGCMAAITPSSPKRGMSSGARIWACSTRQRASSSFSSPEHFFVDVQDQTVGPVADGVGADLEAGLAARRA